ncbi:unnamed protein product [Phyllotreta striolata]|uniref:DUF4455 domain-containing protein n=1 Tax=Phyllotreta striolata TaxID=444603 RepID=A0A9N9XWV4_PHYSR|nr:unnamed protein product [Phyllotreta striolata]
MSAEDVQIIKDLPVNIVPVSSPIPKIEQMLEKKKAAQEALMEKLNKSMREINEDVDAEAKKKTEEINKKLDQVKHDVKRHYVDMKFDLNNHQIGDDFYKKTKKILHKNQKKAVEAVDDFVVFMKKLEESRIKKFKILLKDTKSQSSQLGYELPFYIDEFFGKKMSDINKITINNYEMYDETERELKLQIEQDQKSWYEELLQLKEALKEQIRVLTRRVTTYAEIDDISDQKPEQMAAQLRRLDSLKSEFNYEVTKDDSLEEIRPKIERWLKLVQKHLAAAEQSSKNVIQTYKSMISVLFNRCFKELKFIKIDLANSIVHSSQVQDYLSEMYTPTIDQLMIKNLEELEKLQDTWSKTIQKMTDEINEAYTFLKEAATLWDRYFRRLEELRKLVLRDLDNAIRRHCISTGCHEASLNITMEQLRQAPNKAELDRLLEEAVRILEKIKEAYVEDAQKELNVVQKYKIWMDLSVDLLIMGIRRYLVIHPPDYERDPKKQRRRASQMSVQEQGPSLPIQILYCVYQVGAVSNWMFGLWEGLDQYANACRQEIMATAEKWMARQREKIDERLNTKLSLYQPRVSQIKIVNYEKRLEELKRHEKILNDHKMFIICTKMPDLETQRLVVCSECNDLYDKYAEISDAAIKALPTTNNSAEVKALMTNVYPKLESVEHEVETIVSKCVESFANFPDEVKYMNYGILEKIRLFNEGGDYNLNEIPDLQKELKRIEDISATVKLDDSMYHCSNQMQIAKTTIYSSLTRAFNEHKFLENLVKKVERVHRDVREIVVNLRKSFRKMRQQLENINSKARYNVGNKDYLNEFVGRFQEVLKTAEGLNDYLEHPEPVQLFLKSTRSTKKLESSHTKRSYHQEDPFKSNLQIAGNKDFISSMMNVFKTSLDNIKHTSQEFYSSNKQTGLILDSTKLQPSYEDCLEEIYRKYQPYMLQCEICWLENATKFIQILNEIIEFKDSFISDFKKAFFDKCMRKLEDSAGSIMDDLEQERLNFNERLKQIYTRLKVLFGHPKNNEMLNQLRRDHDEMHADNEEKFRKILDPHKEHLDDVVIKIKTEIESLETILPTLNTDDIIKMIENFMEQIEEKIPLLSTEMFSMYSSSSDVGEYMHEYYQQSRTSYQEIQLKMESLKSGVENKPKVDPIVALDEELEAIKTKMDDFVARKMLQHLEEFKTIWDSEIKYVLSLFKVKYDDVNY